MIGSTFSLSFFCLFEHSFLLTHERFAPDEGCRLVQSDFAARRVSHEALGSLVKHRTIAAQHLAYSDVWREKLCMKIMWDYSDLRSFDFGPRDSPISNSGPLPNWPPTSRF